MRVSYDEKDDVPHMTTGQRAATCAGLLSATDDVALELATSDGHDVIGIIAVGASGYFSPWKGYDAERDILTIGKTTDDPDLITENGDFVGYWQSRTKRNQTDFAILSVLPSAERRCIWRKYLMPCRNRWILATGNEHPLRLRGKLESSTKGESCRERITGKQERPQVRSRLAVSVPVR